MSEELAAVLRSDEGDAVPLAGVTAKGRLSGLLFELTVEQTYENAGATNIEAEYTFPVPHRAVLLGLELQIGARALQAVAVRRQTARENYEEAIDQGDTAALLEKSGEGLYCLSLGNLMAGERAVIRYRYAELLDRAGDEVRLAIPTVIAPRYGDAQAHGLAPHQVPGVDLLAAYPFALTVDVLGEMADAMLRSPSHAIEVTGIAGGRRVTLAAGAMLDRDFILAVSGAQIRAAGIVAPDGEGYVALLSLDPRIAEPVPSPLALKLVVDCSGSMGGDSIGCARRALLAILDRLDARDRVSITRFGSTVEHLPVRVEEPAPAGGLRGQSGARDVRPSERRGVMALASAAGLEWLRHQVRHIEADLGGTQLGAALQATLAIPVDEAPAKNILLITDAEVWAVEPVLDLAARSGHRLFVVAVGAAPAEALARQLAERTGGACEFVSPHEDAEAAIVRTFRRLREAPKRVARIEWPVEPSWQAPLPAAVFSGDTLHLVAGFARLPAGEARVVISGLAEGEISLRAGLPAVTTDVVLPRLAAAKRLPALPEEEAAQLAERYQLTSTYTSLVVVQVRDAGGKAKTLPDLRAVPQMLAAGWGATGLAGHELPMPYATVSLDSFEEALSSVAMTRDCSMVDSIPSPNRRPPARFEALDLYDLTELLDSEGATGVTPSAVLAVLRDRMAARQPLPVDLEDLRRLGVPEGVTAVLDAIVESFPDQPDAEESVVRVWIALLAKSAAGAHLTDTERSSLMGTVLGDRTNRPIRVALMKVFAGVSTEDWVAAAVSA